jgi:hypothetical protein
MGDTVNPADSALPEISTTPGVAAITLVVGVYLILSESWYNLSDFRYSHKAIAIKKTKRIGLLFCSVSPLIRYMVQIKFNNLWGKRKL